MIAVGAVTLVGGDGVLARRQSDLLFLVEPDTALLDAYFAAAPGGGIQAVTAQADERGLDTAAFVVMSWSPDLRVALFGDVEITSDHRSLPRLSAAGSGTWIERSVRADSVRVGVRPDDVDAITDLRDGVVLAGGFCLSVSSDDRTAAVPPPETPGPAGVTQTPTPTPTPTPPDDPAPSRVPDEPPDGHPDPEPERTPGDRLRPPPPRVPPRPPSPPSNVDNSPVAPLRPSDSALQRARSLMGGVETETSLADLVGRSASAGDPTIDVPPHLLATAGPVDVGPSGPDTPWQIRFADGVVEVVDQTLVLGRDPTTDDVPPPARVVPIACKQVSSMHATLEIDERGRLLLTDLASRNRSWIVTTGDNRLIPLDPYVPTSLEHGTHVQVGTKVFVVERLDGPGAGEGPS